MITVKEAMINLCIASGAQSFDAFVAEVKLQATYSVTPADLVRTALGAEDFHFDAESQTYQYRSFS